MVNRLVVLLSVYLTSLLSFSFVSNPIHYCILLLLKSLRVCGYIYMVIGFSWYVVLFCLVYIGGVYILFIFVSVYRPNRRFISVSGWWWLVSFFLLVSFFFGFICKMTPLWVEHSSYLCSKVEGFSYCLFCLVMLIGFICVSIIVNRKDSFYR